MDMRGEMVKAVISGTIYTQPIRMRTSTFNELMQDRHTSLLQGLQQRDLETSIASFCAILLFFVEPSAVTGTKPLWAFIPRCEYRLQMCHGLHKSVSLLDRS